MAKARRELQARLKLVNVVLEIVDARIPDTSRHPRLLADGRPLPRVMLLAKADLADESLTDEWLAYFRARGVPALAGDLRTAGWVAPARRWLRSAAKPKRGSTVRVLVAGLPNVGKSTAINSLAGRSKATTGATAGVTRSLQWLSGGAGLQLLDSPGVLWPEKTTGLAAVYLAATGAVPETAYEPAEAAKELLALLLKRFPEALARRYGRELLTASDALEHVGRRRGCLLPGGGVDVDRAASVVLSDFRSGRLGRFTLERPSEPAEAEGE